MTLSRAKPPTVLQYQHSDCRQHSYKDPGEINCSNRAIVVREMCNSNLATKEDKAGEEQQVFYRFITLGAQDRFSVKGFI